MRRTVLGWTIIRSVKALRKWEKKRSISYPTGEEYEFPILVNDAICTDENSRTDVWELHELIEMARALVHEKDLKALAATKPELFKQIRNIIYKGADPNCENCKGTGRYQLPPAYPRFRAEHQWADCPCVQGRVVTTGDRNYTGAKLPLPEPEFVKPGKLHAAGLAVCIEDRAIHALRKHGELTAGDLGWALWGETTESANRGTGSHRSNKFCRPAGKVLRKLQRSKQVTSRIDGHQFLWRAL